MKSFLIAGNWKMNAGPAHATQLLAELKAGFTGKEPSCEVVICPPYVSLHLAVREMTGTPVRIGAQNVHFESEGAFTGEISARMLRESGCDYVIIGHSERREHFGEQDKMISRKVKKAIEEGLNVILCVGEKLAERKSGDHEQVVRRQLEAVAGRLEESEAGGLVIAYEPVWAIGSGETATPDQARQMHRFIRETLKRFWSLRTASAIRILYGGSMKPDNAEELLRQPDVDGGLIGGASLDAGSFIRIVEISEQLKG